MWQTKCASAVPKSLGLGLNFRPYSEVYFVSGRLWSVFVMHSLGLITHYDKKGHNTKKRWNFQHRKNDAIRWLHRWRCGKYCDGCRTPTRRLQNISIDVDIIPRLGLIYYAWKIGALNTNELKWIIGNWKKSKLWRPFWSCQLNSTANSAHLVHFHSK